MIVANQYLEALNDTGVADLSTSTKLRYINLARQEIFDAYPWPFKLGRSSNVSITDPWTTPLTTSTPGEEQIRGVLGSDGQKLERLTEQAMLGYGVLFDPTQPAPEVFGVSEGYCVYRFMDSPGSRKTYVIPFPYSTEIQVTYGNGPLVFIQETDEDEYIPEGYMMLVVYKAAVHSYSQIGVPDLAANYQQRYVDLFESLVRNQFDTPSIEQADIQYPVE